MNSLCIGAADDEREHGGDKHKPGCGGEHWNWSSVGVRKKSHGFKCATQVSGSGAATWHASD
jgi:hypothetical protein